MAGTPSDSRTTGRITPLGIADSLKMGSKLASHGLDTSPMNQRSDYFEIAGNEDSRGGRVGD